MRSPACQQKYSHHLELDMCASHFAQTAARNGYHVEHPTCRSSLVPRQRRETAAIFLVNKRRRNGPASCTRTDDIDRADGCQPRREKCSAVIIALSCKLKCTSPCSNSKVSTSIAECRPRAFLTHIIIDKSSALQLFLCTSRGSPRLRFRKDGTALAGI
jgi:hypothetical protein